MNTRWAILLLAVIAPSLAVQADILRWDNGATIPGTEDIVLGPGLDLEGFSLVDADLSDTNLRHANLSDANLGHANLSNAFLYEANLSNANFLDANIAGAQIVGRRDYWNHEGAFTKEQLYSTASYKAKELGSLGISSNSLRGWDFSGQDLRGAEFRGVILVDADFTNAMLARATFHGDLLGANLSGADLTEVRFQNANLANADLSSADLTRVSLEGARSDENTVFVDAIITEARISNTMTEEQFRSTSNFQTRDLRRVDFTDTNMIGWDLRNQDLTGAILNGANLANAILDNAIVTKADFRGRPLHAASNDAITGFVNEQLYSTANYRAGNLHEVNLRRNSLIGFDFSGIDLSGAKLGGTKLGGVSFDGAVIIGTEFGSGTDNDQVNGYYAPSNLTKEQLYSTASYQEKDLRGIQLSRFDLRRWDFSGQDLSDVVFAGSRFANVDLTGANIERANLRVHDGFTKEQLYSTASYQQRNLRGVKFGWSSEITDIDLSDQDLTDAAFPVQLTGADFAGATIRNAIFWYRYADRGSSMTKEQLYSTASYARKDLRGVVFPDVAAWDLSEQDLASAWLRGDLDNVNLSGANLNNANLSSANLSLAKFSEGTIYNQWTAFSSDFDAEAAGLTYSVSPIGDLDGNEVLDANDLDLLDRWVEEGRWQYFANRPYWGLRDMFDVNSDSVIDVLDQQYWLRDLTNTQPGDVDLDGEVDFEDFLVLSNNFGDAGSWRNGDFDFDGLVQFGDFLILSQNFGTSSVNRLAIVPEPHQAFSVSLAAVIVLLTRQKRRSPRQNSHAPYRCRGRGMAGPNLKVWG